MGLTVMNALTATLAANAAGSGQILYIDPISPADIVAPGFVDMGVFPEGFRLSPNVEVTREDLKGAGRESAASITLASNVTDSSYGYEFSILTPDDNVRALHAGSPPAELTGTGLTGVKAYRISTEATVVARWVFVKKRPDGSADVVFHPRVQISSNGTTDGDQGSELLGFVVTVQAFSWTPGAALAGLTPESVSQYGALFRAKTPAQLDALLTALNTVAVPEPEPDPENP